MDELQQDGDGMVITVSRSLGPSRSLFLLSFHFQVKERKDATVRGPQKDPSSDSPASIPLFSICKIRKREEYAASDTTLGPSSSLLVFLKEDSRREEATPSCVEGIKVNEITSVIM